MCDAIEEIQAVQLAMVLARARQLRNTDKSKEERHSEAIAQ